MQIVMNCLLSNVSIDEKDGGYKVVLSVPDSEKANVGKLIACGLMVFHCVLVNDVLDPAGAGPVEEYEF